MGLEISEIAVARLRGKCEVSRACAVTKFKKPKSVEWTTCYRKEMCCADLTEAIDISAGVEVHWRRLRAQAKGCKRMPVRDFACLGNSCPIVAASTQHHFVAGLPARPYWRVC